ncbi:SDR family oxidoreductase [Acinetobacter baumannii]|uniref:SDR family oxidoreductase n=1 Tax=Acinetobacter baumannii TaxID=470 RepID=UPI0002BC3474|nr:SDR family oxidoreductase [Acinetobacter baumannii]AGH34259.1 putative short-chain dehydrogenase [Acinetobacter baumannii D1279779]EHZ6731026.1 SDR family oxidoreductase [Acinetobacter baumannii]EKT8701752.1 SDR family oxidoreductase [Acinetobacter baumannii]EKT9842391.1 SDR family oxidoreductase [Acinetobacter baumannii]EKT9846747.1 SDR family oxidoreductase [Acinetobacter baumannii]
MTTHSLKDKVVLITGGAKNLGGLISRKFAEQGAKLAIHYNSSETQADAEQTLADVKALGADAILIQADLTDIDNIEKLFLDTKQHFGGIDIAINTVGKVLKKPFLETTEQEFDSMSDINSKIAYFFIQSAGRHLKNGGKICSIVTSLLAAYTGFYSTYEGLKAPVEHYTRAASKEFGDRQISVTSVAPGPMDTPFFYGQESAEAVAYHKSASALGGLTKIEDIEPLVRFLVTDGWWITGQTIFANGGYTTR